MQELLVRAADVLPLESLDIDREQFLQPASQISGTAMREALVSTGGALTNVVSNGVRVLIFLCFLLFGRGGSGEGFSGWAEIESNVRRYIVVKSILSLTTGLLTGAILLTLGIDLAILFGLLAFLLNFIPSIGSIIAVVLPLPVVLVSPDMSPTTAVLAFALPGAVQFGLGNVLEPRLMGQRFDLHPIAVILSLIFWGMLWGTIGMFLATPITAVTRILLQKHAATRPMAELLSGRIGDNEAEGPSIL